MSRETTAFAIAVGVLVEALRWNDADASDWLVIVIAFSLVFMICEAARRLWGRR